ncbi:MAG: hypothetical protein ACYTFV_06635 [Planctomycetota bacterium]|jgi:hypothetical protein
MLAALLLLAPCPQAVTEQTTPTERPRVQMPYEIPIGEPLIFDRVWTRRRVDGGVVEDDALHRSRVTLEVKGLDEAGNRLLDWSAVPGTWERLASGGNPVDRATDQGIAELRTDVEYVVRVSPKFRTILLEDPTAVAREAELALTRANARIDATGSFIAQRDRAKAIVQAELASPELIEHTFLREPLILLDPLGRDYRFGRDRRWQDFFINPIGSAPLAAMSWIEPIAFDSERGELLVRTVRALDRSATRSALERDLDSWLKRNKVPSREVEPDQDFSVREETRALLDIATGLPLYAEHRSWVRILDDERVESVAFVALGFEPGEELTGTWSEPEDAADPFAEQR